MVQSRSVLSKEDAIILQCKLYLFYSLEKPSPSLFDVVLCGIVPGLAAREQRAAPRSLGVWWAAPSGCVRARSAMFAQ